MAESVEKIRNRVVRFQLVRGQDLRPNPANWKKHPPEQLAAIRAALTEIGFCGVELVRELADGSLELIDGHARASIAADAEIWAAVLNVDEHEAKKLLLSFDPLAAMAETSAADLDRLLREVNFGQAELQEMAAKLADDAGLYQVDDEPNEPDAAEAARAEPDPTRTVTYTVHADQYSVIARAIARCKQTGGGVSDANDDADGNAIAAICDVFLRIER